MLEFFNLIKQVARSGAPVLIRGETGTGKELVAKAIHQESCQRQNGFYAQNCASLTPDLMLSELFGHVKGAFTGAVADRKGIFQLAHRGTLFLDEIAEIPFDIQSRLLRAIESQEIFPVGSSTPVKCEFRLLSATHKALRQEAKEGRFRHDLMYRIRVVPIFLPRLAEREGDVEMLAKLFINRLNQREGRSIENISSQALDALLEYSWPGNIRELQNNIEFAFATGVGPTLNIQDLTPELRGESPPGIRQDPQSPLEAERETIQRALKECRGVKGRAAEKLGISRSTLWRKLREHRLSCGTLA